MTGFDADWLALREPADLQARDPVLLAAATKAIEDSTRNLIVDIGAGTGSTFRALSMQLQRQVRWQLFDHDRRLLDEAGRRHGTAVDLVQADLNQIDRIPLAEASLITASALFDLCSEDFIERFVAAIAEANVVLYAALSYDGEMEWSEAHPLDFAVTASFNAHQVGDKGFGPSLGPGAWQYLAHHLREAGYHVRVAASPWLLTSADAELQKLFVNGVVQAVSTRTELDETALLDWAEFRHRMVGETGSLCRVGHQDVLALR
jgi:hypothetical protein